jgi:hypothetical protein
LDTQWTDFDQLALGMKPRLSVNSDFNQLALGMKPRNFLSTGVCRLSQ